MQIGFCAGKNIFVPSLLFLVYVFVARTEMCLPKNLSSYALMAEIL